MNLELRPTLENMAISVLEQQRVSGVLDMYCVKKWPPQFKDQVELQYRFDATSVILFEKRPAWDNPKESVELLVAKFRYFAGRGEWELYWRDRNSDWHQYDLLKPNKRFEVLLSEVDKDPTCIFWG